MTGRILNFGSCNIDYVYSVGHIVRGGETISAAAMNTFAGGKGLNQSVAAARAGAKVYHAGCLGRDADVLTDILKDNGVDMSNIKIADEKCGHAIIQVDKDGQNSIIIFSGTNGMVDRTHIDAVLEKFCAEDIVILQNEISNVDYIIEKAAERGMRIIFNPSPVNQALDRVDFSKVSYLILNEVEAEYFCPKCTSDEFLEFMKKEYPSVKVVLTLGENGSVYGFGNERIYQRAYPAKTVDTTAAGDTYTGYFAAALSEGCNEAEAMKRASLAASVTVSRNGAAPSIAYMQEVAALIVEQETK